MRNYKTGSFQLLVSSIPVSNTAQSLQNWGLYFLLASVEILEIFDMDY